MPYTVDDEKTSPFAPDDESGARTARLPEPPAYEAGDTHVQQPVDEQQADDQQVDDSVAPADQTEGTDDADATRPQPAVHADQPYDQSAHNETGPQGHDEQPWHAETGRQSHDEQPWQAEPAAGRTDEPFDTESLFRQQPTEVIAAPAAATTAVLPAGELSAEEQKLAAERAARREAREQALAQPDVRSAVAPEPVVIVRRTTDRFLGAFSLFLLRLVVAAIMGVRGFDIVTNLPLAEQQFAATIIPEPRIAAMVVGYASLAIAAALVFGLLTRLAGLGVTLITAGALVFVLWGDWSPFIAGRPGFVGELELLLAVVGLVFLCVGAGGFSLDRSFRKSRERDRVADQGL